MSEIIAKMLIKVYLVSGREITHTYELPTSEKEFKNLIKDKVGRTVALMRDRKKHLYFENQNITYNADNVEGIEISSIGVKELESLLEKAQSGIGFIKQ